MRQLADAAEDIVEILHLRVEQLDVAGRDRFQLVFGALWDGAGCLLLLGEGVG